ncbi:ferritin-like domain-containing protein [Polyangium fumosum]|uniref:Ferritin-like domain-containing protein n=2 Tax=Polyangium fumosum TaxID=889272 RepID=A0A4U1IS45_9BACT|nr:ferritin-like domain-containing protein [Polyangium fumosum]
MHVPNSPNYCSAVVKTDGVFQDGQCCYDVTYETCGAAGRPFIEEGRARAAMPARGLSSWMESALPAPDLAGLSPDERALLAAAWTRDGLLEHASIASFGRFALELLAVGAPANLVTRAHEAALDEVRHARLAFALASAYAGEPLGPGAFPFVGGNLSVSADLADVAARAVREGCIGETLASLVAAEQAARATDPAVREALAAIAEDEARHAELAWRAVAWAIGSGDAAVARAVRAAFAQALAAGASFEVQAGGAGALEAHGRPDAAVLRASMARALDEVVRPAAEALLGSLPAPAREGRERAEHG